MKIKKEKTLFRCDFCRKEQDYMDVCLGCGKHICFDCITHGKGIEYSHRVHFRGGGDGHYCNACDADRRHRINHGLPKDPLHSAYLAIHQFKLRLEEQYKEDQKTTKELEEKLASLQK